jgi:hypothetical protein
MLGQCGYTERAVALFQGLIELNLFAPISFSSYPFPRKLGLFKDFWEKECKRFGENGALGWNQSLELDPYICDDMAEDHDKLIEEDQFNGLYLLEFNASFKEW